MGYLNNQFEKKASYNLATLASIPVTASIGAGALLSDKDSAMDKLKTGLAAGAGASAGVVLPAASTSIVTKILQPAEEKALRVWRKLSHSTDDVAATWYNEWGKNRAKYELYAPQLKMTPEDMMEKARKAFIRHKATDKAWRILNKVRKNNSIKINKLQAILPPLIWATAPLGGYLGYKYMED